jgi:hypothetical protein
MPVPSTAVDISTTASSNSPTGSDLIGNTLDEYLRATQAILKQQCVQGADIASGTTLALLADGNTFDITGTATISGISSTYSWTGRIVYLKFDGALTLTHNATTLILPGGANITTSAGDWAAFRQDASGEWRCLFYQYISGANVTGNAVVTGTLSVDGDATLGDSTSADSHTFNGVVSHTANTSTSAQTVTQLGTGKSITVEGSANALINGTNGNTIGTMILSLPSGGTQAQENIGPSLAFTGINTARRKAMIASKQTGTNANQTGIAFYTYSGTTTSIDDVAYVGQWQHTGELLVGRTTTAGATANLGWLLGPSGVSSSYMSGTGSNTHMVFANNAAVTPTTVGSISSSGSNTTYATSSDYRLKDKLTPLTGSGEFIDSLIPWQGVWKPNGSKFVGFIAHEFAQVSPSSVVGEKDAVDEDGNPIYQAMQASSAEVMANIVAELQSLRKRVADMEAQQ